MNTEILDYFKQLSKKEYFWINFINMILSIAVIILGIVGLVDGLIPITYAFMFLTGAVMMLLNFHKGRKSHNKNSWIFFIGSMGFAALSVMFFIML